MPEPDLDEEAVRLTAYFMWEQDGRPNSNPQDYWERALEMHRRANAYGQELEEGYEAHNGRHPPDLSGSGQ